MTPPLESRVQAFGAADRLTAYRQYIDAHFPWPGDPKPAIRLAPGPVRVDLATPLAVPTHTTDRVSRRWPELVFVHSWISATSGALVSLDGRGWCLRLLARDAEPGSDPLASVPFRARLDDLLTSLGAALPQIAAARAWLAPEPARAAA